MDGGSVARVAVVSSKLVMGESSVLGRLNASDSRILTMKSSRKSVLGPGIGNMVYQY